MHLRKEFIVFHQNSLLLPNVFYQKSVQFWVGYACPLYVSLVNWGTSSLILLINVFEDKSAIWPIYFVVYVKHIVIWKIYLWNFPHNSLIII